MLAGRVSLAVRAGERERSKNKSPTRVSTVPPLNEMPVPLFVP